MISWTLNFLEAIAPMILLFPVFSHAKTQNAVGQFDVLTTLVPTRARGGKEER